jgi:hypothetical protein
MSITFPIFLNQNDWTIFRIPIESPNQKLELKGSPVKIKSVTSSGTPVEWVGKVVASKSIVNCHKKVAERTWVEIFVERHLSDNGSGSSDGPRIGDDLGDVSITITVLDDQDKKEVITIKDALFAIV